MAEGHQMGSYEDRENSKVSKGISDRECIEDAKGPVGDGDGSKNHNNSDKKEDSYYEQQTKHGFW